MTVDRKDLACRIYQFMYESGCGYENSLSYETAETVLNIYADLSDDLGSAGWMEEIVKELQFCTENETSARINDFLGTEEDVKCHITEGFEILKDMYYLIIERSN